LAQHLLELSPTHVLDPMGGTGTVSHALSLLGIEVTYGDLFRFNVQAARGLFTSNKENVLQARRAVQTAISCDGIITREFSGMFFTDDENRWLDGVMKKIGFGKAEGYRNVLFYALAQACLKKRPYNLFHRANLYMRLSDVPRTFGNLVTWNTSFVDHINTSLLDAIRVSESLVAPITVVDACDATDHKGNFDLVYVDPPYFRKKSSTDSYMRRYHFLEGLANYSNWHTLFDVNSGVKEFKQECRPSEWDSADKVLAGIFSVAETYSRASLAISYVDEEEPSIRRITHALKKVRKKVRHVSIATSTALSNSTRREMLIIATN